MIATMQYYRLNTGDRDTADGDVSDALVAGQGLLESHCKRHFEQATRTEICRLYPNGRVYPKATPLISVSTGPTTIIDGHSILLGYAYWWAPGINPFVSGFGSDSTTWVPQVSVTYVGGYAPADMPSELMRAVVQIAYQVAHPAVLAGVPVGATNVRLGDLSLSGSSLSAFAVLSDETKSTIARYKRRTAMKF